MAKVERQADRTWLRLGEAFPHFYQHLICQRPALLDADVMLADLYQHDTRIWLGWPKSQSKTPIVGSQFQRFEGACTAQSYNSEPYQHTDQSSGDERRCQALFDERHSLWHSGLPATRQAEVFSWRLLSPKNHGKGCIQFA
jgi:hypothetical protein